MEDRFSLVESILDEIGGIDPETGEITIVPQRIPTEFIDLLRIPCGAAYAALAQASGVCLDALSPSKDRADPDYRQELLDTFQNVLNGCDLLLDVSAPWAEEAPIIDLLVAIGEYMSLISALEEYIENGSRESCLSYDEGFKAPLNVVEQHPEWFLCMSSAAFWWNAIIKISDAYTSTAIEDMLNNETDLEGFPLPLRAQFPDRATEEDECNPIAWLVGLHPDASDIHEVWCYLPVTNDPPRIYTSILGEDDPCGIIFELLIHSEQEISELMTEVINAYNDFLDIPQKYGFEELKSWMKDLLGDQDRLEFSFDRIPLRRTIASLDFETEEIDVIKLGQQYRKQFKKCLSPSIRKTIRKAKPEIELIIAASRPGQSPWAFMSENPSRFSLLSYDMVERAMRVPRGENHRTEALREELVLEVVKKFHGKTIPKDLARKALKNS